MKNPLHTQPKNTNPAQLSGFEREFVKECFAMAKFAVRAGKPMDMQQLTPLLRMIRTPIADWDLLSIVPCYNYLAQLIKPATPSTLVLFDNQQLKKGTLTFLGPIPIVQTFMLTSILALVGVILFSLSPHLNQETIQESMLDGEGTVQLLRLCFLLCWAALGSSFSALFKMNHYINRGTFNVKYNTSYTTRFVLGIVAGLLLSELFVAMVESGLEEQQEAGLSEIQVLLKPIMAILGGYSATLVHRVLNRLVNTMEMIFQVNKGGESKPDKEVSERLEALRQTMMSNATAPTVPQDPAPGGTPPESGSN